MATLEELRQSLDEVDNQIVGLLNERARLALEVKKTKQRDKLNVYSPARERQILGRVLELGSRGDFPQVELERIFTSIISASRSLIGELSVSYLGAEYSLGHDAAIMQFGDSVQFTPEASLEEVFRKVERKYVNYGVIPIHGGAQGVASRTCELLMESSLAIIAEIEVEERLELFSRAGSLSDIKRVYSDAYYFSRAESWMATNIPEAERVLERSVASALKNLSLGEDAGLIASHFAGKRSEFRALASGIEGSLGVPARFLVLGHETPAPTGSDKTSLLCSVEEKAGALREMLQPFAENKVTLLKIESHPVRSRAWEYMFLIDIAGHVSEPSVWEAIERLRELSVFLRVLGSYPRASR
jgi:chorismate mutase/prephenate dehydratase